MANPLAMILSASMMLKYDLARPDEAVLLERAVEAVLDAGLRTTDIFQVAAAVAALAHPPPPTHTHTHSHKPQQRTFDTRVSFTSPPTHTTHTHTTLTCISMLHVHYSPIDCSGVWASLAPGGQGTNTSWVQSHGRGCRKCPQEAMIPPPIRAFSFCE